MEYTEKEMKTIEQAKSNLLRGNDIESATFILEKVILDGMIIKCGRINILKVAARQIINFIEEYKNKEYLDVAREKVYANEESRRKDELIEKQRKEIEKLKEHLNQYYDGKLFTANQLKATEKEQNKYFIHKDKIREKIKELNDNRPYLSKFDDWKEKEYTNEDVTNKCVEILEDLLGDE